MDSNADDKHKFQVDSGMTFEEVYSFAFGANFTRLLRSLADELEADDFIEMLERASSRAGAQRGQEEAESGPSNDFASFVASMEKPDRLWRHTLTLDVVERTERALEIEVTECLWSKTFRDAGASDIGYAAFCHPDFAVCQAYNPRIRMTRTKTLMQGDDFCNHRWVWEE